MEQQEKKKTWTRAETRTRVWMNRSGERTFAETGEERTGCRTTLSQRCCWTSTTATTATTCKRMRGDGGVSKQ